MSSSKRLMEWIDEEGVTVKKWLSYTKKTVPKRRLSVESKVVPNPFQARRKFSD